MPHFNEKPMPLSAQGQMRQQHMLQALQVRMRRYHTQRKVLRVAGASSVLLGLILLLVLRTPSPVSQEATPPSAIAANWTIVHNQALSKEILLTDEELIELLKSENLPTGLIRSGKQVFLEFAQNLP